MSQLYIYNHSDLGNPEKVTSDYTEMSDLLNEAGVCFERWPTSNLESNASQETILEAYAAEVAHFKQECGFTTADVVRLTPDHPEKTAFRQKFLNEHRHAEDEVRFFVEGQGLFYLHIDNKIYVVLCEQNDLISVPEQTAHWFDMGPEPRFTCIRLFTNPEGWVAEFTGDDIAEKMPRFETLAL